MAAAPAAAAVVVDDDDNNIRVRLITAAERLAQLGCSR